MSDEQVNGLCDRTEGWVAGLQLASLSLGQTERRDEFIHSFSGEARDVAEYAAATAAHAALLGAVSHDPAGGGGTGVACVHDDVEVLERLASQPLQEYLLLPFHLGAMYNMLGYSRLVNGDFKLARDALAKSRRYHEQAGASFGLAYCGIFSGMLNRIQGKLHSAAADFRQSEDISILDSGERSAGAAVARLMQGVVLYEWNRIDEAERLIVANISLVEECTIAEALVLGCITLARIRVGQGRREDAERCYAKIRAICERRKFRRLLLLVENDYVRMLINDDDLASAEQVAGRLNIDMDGEHNNLTDRWEAAPCLEVLIRARVLRARGQPDRALKDLRRLRNLAIKAGRIRLSIEILTLMALAEFDQGAHASMRKSVLAALHLSPASGFLKIFLDEGENVGAMMQWVRDHCGKELPAAVDHQLRAILAACAGFFPAAQNQEDGADMLHGLVEALSTRELEVLELIVSGHSNGQIGAQLEIAESTVKWHAKNIFGKLGVKNRTSAALAAQQLRLIGRRPLL